MLNLTRTWEKNHPQWDHRLWDAYKIDAFLNKHYPLFIPEYSKFKYSVQGWDAIRYLLIYHYGGLYVDMDYESLEPIDKIIENCDCFFGEEPEEHKPSDLNIYIGNSLFGSRKHHPFIRLLVKMCFETPVNIIERDKIQYVLETTGPLMVTRMYNDFSLKQDVTLLPAHLVSPWSVTEAQFMLSGHYTSIMEEKLEKSCCVHYFFGSWLEKQKI